MNWKIKLIKQMNKFCFSKRHDNECNGCIFKKCKKCPLNTVVENLEANIYDNNNRTL